MPSSRSPSLKGQPCVPGPVRSQVLQWGHSSQLACHPGANQTLGFLQQRFWWPRMAQGVRESQPVLFAPAESLPIYPHLVYFNHSPFLSIPGHICPLTVTGLSASNGNTGILMVVDRFSKMLHFIPLPKLSSVGETGDILVLSVF